MAYIDKELFKQDIKMRYCNNCARPNEIKCRACNIDDMLGEIEDAPTADVVEVKHGEWKSYNTECSICKRINPTLFLDEFFGKYKALHLEYCPNCGAKMDGKDNGQ